MQAFRSSLAETLSGWGFPGKKKRASRPSEDLPTSDQIEDPEDMTEVAPPETQAEASSPTAETRPSESIDEEPVARVDSTPTPELTEEEGDPPESIASMIRRGLETGIEELMTLYPQGGKDTDAQDLLNSVMGSTLGNVHQPPAAAQAVLSLCQRNDYSLLDLIELIERDPSLSAALLRHANSAWYATPGAGPVLGLRAAVHRVGTQGVHAAVMSRILQGTLSRPGARFNRPARMVWDHMVRVAPIARQLATHFGIDVHAAFSLGLMHDVGKLVLFHYISDLRRTRRREVRISEQFLRGALASLHQPLGGLTVLEWGLDEKAAHVVANHHRCPKPVPEDVFTEVVFLAERIDIAEQRGETLDVEPLWDAAELTGPRAPVMDLVKSRTEYDF